MKPHEQAQAWREKLNLTQKQLAELTGYSAIAISWFENGRTPSNRNVKSGSTSRKIKKTVWQRYKNVCAGVDAQIRARKAFEW